MSDTQDFENEILHWDGKPIPFKDIVRPELADWEVPGVRLPLCHSCTDISAM